MATVDATNLAMELALDTIEAPALAERFPDRAYLVGSDDPHFDALVREGRDEGCPVVVLFPGHQYLILNTETPGDAASLAGELHLVS